VDTFGKLSQSKIFNPNNKHSKDLLSEVLALASASLNFLFSVPLPTTVIAFWYRKVGKFRFFLFFPFFLIWSFYYSFLSFFFSIPPDCKRLFKHETKIEQYILDCVVCSRIPFFERFFERFFVVFIFHFFVMTMCGIQSGFSGMIMINSSFFRSSGE